MPTIAGIPQPAPKPPTANTPTPEQTTATPTTRPTNTLAPTSTLEPTETPAAAWLEPDPETITFDGSGWLGFTVQGTGVGGIDLGINVVNYPDGPSSSGRVARSTRITPPAISDACRNTGFEGETVDADDKFSLLGCWAGTVIIQLAHYVGSDYVLPRRYTVAVSGGP